MVFNPIGSEMELVWDLVAMVISIIAVMMVVQINGIIQKKGILSSDVTRKIVHIFAGPVFIVTWILYSGGVFSRFFAMVVPILFVLLFVGIGTGKVKNEAFVDSMSRSGDPSELLKGTLYYAIWIAIITIVWFYVPAGNVSAANPMALVIIGCVAGGDGFADVIGRKFGGEKKFGIGGSEKTIAGSIGMFIGAFLFSVILISIFALEVMFDIVALILPILIISVVVTIVEALSPPSTDNWTVPITVIVIAIILSQFGLWPYALTTL